MKRTLAALFLISIGHLVQAQLSPAITSWLINTTGITGRHYLSGSSVPLSDTAHANVQKVQYSTAYAYINCSGIPSYIVGPYLDGNPSQATNNVWFYKIPLNPAPQTGTKTTVGMGDIGVFVNGVPMYNYADGKSYNNLGIWNRSAVYFENSGFDCAKGHPSPIFSGGMGGTLIGGSYHHHQNPTAFNLDKVVVSNVCDLYLADGLYVMDSTVHSPLIGYAFDGYPVYGAYAYDSTDGSGGIRRMQSSYQMRSITTRTTLPDGTVLSSGQYGPTVSTTYPLGCFKEDFEYIAGSGDLDEHNGRFCVTPEYPSGTYAYFATVDANQNSYYPYLIGPTYYGVVETSNLNQTVTITETVTTYSATGIDATVLNGVGMTVYPNPASDLVAVQINRMLNTNLDVQMLDITGRKVQESIIYQGSTIAYIDTRTLYNGEYIILVSDGSVNRTFKVIVTHE